MTWRDGPALCVLCDASNCHYRTSEIRGQPDNREEMFGHMNALSNAVACNESVRSCLDRLGWRNSELRWLLHERAFCSNFTPRPASARIKANASFMAYGCLLKADSPHLEASKIEEMMAARKPTIGPPKWLKG